MRIISITFCVLALGLLTDATYVPGSQVPRDTFYDVHRCNTFIDGLLEELTTRYRNEIDPYPLSNRTTFIGWVSKVEVQLYNGYVSGLSNLHRKGDCHIVISKEGGHKVNVTVGTDELNLSILSKAKIFGEKNAHIRGKTDHTLSLLMLDIRKDSGRPFVEEHRVLSQGYVDFSVDRETFLDKIFDRIVDYIAIFWKNSISQAIENKIDSLIDQMLAND